MAPAFPHPTNFAFLEQHDEQLVRLGMLAERYFADDPNTCVLKLRQFGELLAPAAEPGRFCQDVLAAAGWRGAVSVGF